MMVSHALFDLLSASIYIIHLQDKSTHLNQYGPKQILVWTNKKQRNKQEISYSAE